MKDLRPHRFPPLSQLTARANTSPTGDASGAGDIADGFQIGMAKGYEEGLQAGRKTGHRKGLSSGREEAMKLGLEQGRQEVLAQYDNLALPLDAALQSLQQLQADYQSALRKEVVELVAKVARQVIRCELALQPQQLLTMVDETLATLPRVGDEEVTIYLNPEELQRIQELDAERAKRWKLLPDSRLEHGECHVKAGTHEADAGCRQRQAAVMEKISAQLIEPPVEVSA
jgi:flagellar assembly protein FliH